MNMRQVPCILGPCSKDLSVLYYVLYWDHLSLYGHMERKEILNPSSCKEGDHVKDLESRVVVNLLCNWRFWKQQNEYSYRKCMATPCIERTDFWFKMLLIFKASMPLLANLTFRNGLFLVSVVSPTLTALKSLFEEISKIIPWNRCPGDPTSAKCKVKVDSYKACSRFNGREYSFVRIWWRPNCKLTNGKNPWNETSCISGLLYFLEPWLRCLLLVLSNRFKTFTDCHPGLVRFPMLSMWSLQPYGATVPSCRIQCSSRFLRKGVLKLGLFVGWYIFSNIRTFMDRIEWSGRLKCR